MKDHNWYSGKSITRGVAGSLDGASLNQDAPDAIFSPLSVSAPQSGDRDIRVIEKVFINFLSRWRLAVQLIVPSVELDFELSSVNVVSYDHYVRSTADLVEVDVYSLVGSNIEIGFIYERKLIPQLVNFIFGGNESQQVEDHHRRLTSLDKNIARRVFSLMTVAFETSMSQINPQVCLAKKRHERRISHLRIAYGSDELIQAKLIFRLNGLVSAADFCIPRRAFQILMTNHESGSTNNISDQEILGNQDKNDILPTEMRLRAVYAGVDVSMEELSQLAVGKILKVKKENKDLVVVHTNDGQSYSATAGLINAQYAVKKIVGLPEAGDAVSSEDN